MDEQSHGEDQPSAVEVEVVPGQQVLFTVQFQVCLDPFPNQNEVGVRELRIDHERIDHERWYENLHRQDIQRLSDKLGPQLNAVQQEVMAAIQAIHDALPQR